MSREQHQGHSIVADRPIIRFYAAAGESVTGLAGLRRNERRKMDFMDLGLNGKRARVIASEVAADA
jgi:hypothetical protein